MLVPHSKHIVPLCVCSLHELSRSTEPDSCIGTSEICLLSMVLSLSHNTLQRNDIVNVAFTCIPISVLPDVVERVFQKLDIISFGIQLADVAENSMWDMMCAKA